MLATNATRPARFKETMRRVRLGKLRAKTNWPTRRSQSRGRSQRCAVGFSAPAVLKAADEETSTAFKRESGCVRSSNGTAGWFDCVFNRLVGSHCNRNERRRQSNKPHSQVSRNQVSLKR